MPNWCNNTLEVWGDKEQIKEFKKKGRVSRKDDKTDLSLDRFVPIPKELKGTTAPSKKTDRRLIKKYGADNWYDWRLNNWGTKWDVDAELVNENIPRSKKYNEGFLVYVFDSAWSPPIEWLEKMCKQYKKLRFKLKYEEPLMGFMGVAIAENGEITSNQSIDY